jgi:hypothetical protein
MPRLALCVLVAAAIAALTAPAALATDYCVAPNTSCGGTNVATLEAALDAADDSPDSDRIFLGAATYTAAAASGFSYAASISPVEIAGQGVGKTVLTSPVGGSNRVLKVIAGPGSSIHDLTVRLPQNAATGLAGVETSGLAQRIAVEEAATQVNFRFGVRLTGGALEDSTVTISGDQHTIGVHAGQGGEAIRRSTIEANTGVYSSFGATVERSVLRAGSIGLDAERLTTTITDSLIELISPSSTGFYVGAQGGYDTTVNADGVTLIGTVVDTTGVYAATTSAPAQNVTVNVVDAVFRGLDSTLQTAATGSGKADINASYSDYDAAGNIDGGTGAITASNVTNLGDPRFVNAAGGDYRLRFDSPLRDVGEPGAPTTTLDLSGGARLVGARRDIGAFEYQARPPVAAIAGPASAGTGERVMFSAAGSSDPDPGDTLSYTWTLDGAPAGTGPTLSASFATGGAHAVGLTVADPTGRKASAGHTVTVSAPAAPPAPSDPPAPAADTTAPVVSGLLARPARVRSGRPIGFRFELDEAGAVSVEIQRARPGRREHGACARPSRRNRGGRRCTRFVHVTTMAAAGAAGANQVRFSGRLRGRALAAGHYRAVVRVTDAGGNRSLARRAPFTVAAAAG